MAQPRPARTFITLSVTIVLGLGIAAYLINFPVRWIVVGEVLAMLGIAWRVSRRKQPQPVTQGQQDAAPKR
jgi:hypothetical protein